LFPIGELMFMISGVVFGLAGSDLRRPPSNAAVVTMRNPILQFSRPTSTTTIIAEDRNVRGYFFPVDNLVFRTPQRVTFKTFYLS